MTGQLPSPCSAGVSRRAFVIDAAAAVAGATLTQRVAGRRWWAAPRAATVATSSQLEALRVLGRGSLRMPGSLPNAALPAGTDTLPEIEHVVVLMLENHSYDNLLGMLGRGFGQRPRGDGFTLAADGLPDANNPYPDGRRQRAFRMPTTCQLSGTPSQEWLASHNAYNNGAMDGFVRTPISPGTTRIVGPVAMGYWQREDLPFTYSLASTFPIGDRWFSSCLAQTDPQRRYLIAATSSGMTDDIGTGPGSIVPDGSLGAPANGTIFNRLSDAGISWIDYAESFPTGATMELYPDNDGAYSKTNVKSFAQFFDDAKAGALPSFSLLDPNYGTQSQEDPQNITVGEAMLAQVVDALGNSPLWRKVLLLVTYDEGGGYYDHVPPPAALAPDAIPPQVQPGESTYDGFARYGFRVPAIVVGPYAKRNHVSHVVYDHTSILAFLERKWNLASMTLRDANANDLLDFIDTAALARRQPTFPELPKLARPGADAARLACSRTGPGSIPVPLPPARVLVRSVSARRRPRGVVVELQTDPGTLNGVQVWLFRGRRHVGYARVDHVIERAPRRVFLHIPGSGEIRGRYTVLVTLGRRRLARRAVELG